MTKAPAPNLPVTRPQPDSPPDPPPEALDAHGFDPLDFDWIPVARKPRSDGWTPRLQKIFIGTLADSGSVTEAARAAGMTVTSCYRLRRAPGAEGFAGAWEAALRQASSRLIDIAFDRAVNGTEEPVLDRDGNCIYIRQRTNDRLLMFLLRHHHPARYRPDRPPQAEIPAAPAAVALTSAIESLAPVTPENPHLLMDKEDFADFLFNAADDTPPLAALSSLSDAPAQGQTTSSRKTRKNR